MGATWSMTSTCGRPLRKRGGSAGQRQGAERRLARRRCDSCERRVAACTCLFPRLRRAARGARADHRPWLLCTLGSPPSTRGRSHWRLATRFLFAPSAETAHPSAMLQSSRAGSAPTRHCPDGWVALGELLAAAALRAPASGLRVRLGHPRRRGLCNRRRIAEPNRRHDNGANPPSGRVNCGSGTTPRDASAQDALLGCQRTVSQGRTRPLPPLATASAPACRAASAPHRASRARPPSALQRKR